MLSLGKEGHVDLEFTDFAAFDGPGVDFLVFENQFGGFVETGFVSVSDDGVSGTNFPVRRSTATRGTPVAQE